MFNMFSPTARVAFIALTVLLCTTFLLLPGQASILGSGGGQHPFTITDSSKRVAVIGAGAAGASTAYFVKEYAEKQDLPVNITVFERNSYIGGRTTTVNAYDDPEQPIELGGSIFVQVNHNLFDAATKFGLPISRHDSSSADGADQLGVWDGKQFTITIKDGGWVETIKMLWKYGFAPMRTQSLVKKTVDQFLKMYEAPVFPWKSLTQTAMDLELTAVTSTTGYDYLKANNIGPPFSTDLIQASTRVNYASNLGHIHGLETMVAMSTDGAMAIAGGNWQIFSEMIKSSKASLLLETAVTSIERNASKKSWVIKATKASGEKLVEEYDEVVIAAPYQYSNITSKSIKAPETIKYITLHVTLFASPHRLSPKYFNSSKEMVPDMILTTLPIDHDPLAAESGPSVFWSVNILRVVERKLENGVTRQEYIYKIFSPEYWPNEKINEMMGQPAEASILTWTYRKVWESYPKEEPRSTFQEAQLDFGLWYTAGMEGFISCMETMSLAGKNVAANIVEGWAAARVAAESAVHSERSL